MSALIIESVRYSQYGIMFLLFPFQSLFLSKLSSMHFQISIYVCKVSARNYKHETLSKTNSQNTPRLLNVGCICKVFYLAECFLDFIRNNNNIMYFILATFMLNNFIVSDVHISYLFHSKLSPLFEIFIELKQKTYSSVLTLYLFYFF